MHAGPSVVEIVGERPFVPETCEYAMKLTEKQQKLKVHMQNEIGQITNRYIKGEERSFTIIAYPVPAIGDQFEEIFRETVKINTLDYNLYQQIQQKLIDALDLGTSVHILGKGENRTDLRVQLHKLEDPEKQTNFENCVADVNIPVGEVFTSPKLTGTNGKLHVTKVYLNELQYQNLELVFTDGKITEYSCTNFDSEEENKKYIRENILYHHPTLPMGEFAIGTNTTAYRVAREYGIEAKLPILIAEKTGPHFAVGDTCYSWAEDTKVYNPDGKEIIARDNEVSILRKEDVSKAYLGCHTDITIPYDELGAILVETADGRQDIDVESEVSMNMWGLTPGFFWILEAGFADFLEKTAAEDLKAEYLLPTIIGGLLNDKKVDVKVLQSKDKWFGVTYKEDKETVVNSIKELISQGHYQKRVV